ncbi:MAG: hypothetical protein WAW73_20240 [Rhodoferax sp.]
MSAYTTDWKALGLPDDRSKNAFTAVPPKGPCRPYVAKKHSPALPKVQQAAMALETPEERRERQKREAERKLMDQQGRPRVDLAPRTTGAITIHSQADAAKTSKIRRGRAI